MPYLTTVPPITPNLYPPPSSPSFQSDLRIRMLHDAWASVIQTAVWRDRTIARRDYYRARATLSGIGSTQRRSVQSKERMTAASQTWDRLANNLTESMLKESGYMLNAGDRLDRALNRVGALPPTYPITPA